MSGKKRTIPTQTLLGGQLHNLAYITPAESHVLRSMGGGVTPSGGQRMANGIPSYRGPPGPPPAVDKFGVVIPQRGGSLGALQKYNEYKKNYDQQVKLAAQAAGSDPEAAKAAIAQGGIILYDPKRDYAKDPAHGIMYEAPSYDKHNRLSGAVFRTPTGQTLQAGNYGGINAHIPLPMGGLVRHYPHERGGQDKYYVKTMSPSGSMPGVFTEGNYGTYGSQYEADMALAKIYNRDLEAGRIDPATGMYIDTRVPGMGGDEDAAGGDSWHSDASNVGLTRYEQSGNPQDLILSKEEADAAKAAFQAGLLAQQEANPLPNAGISLLQSGLIS